MKQQEILFLVIGLFTIVIAWISFSLYHNAVSSTISDTLSVQIQPLTPTFDLATINQLKQKNVIQPLYDIDAAEIASKTAQKIIVPTLAPTTLTPSPTKTQTTITPAPTTITTGTPVPPTPTINVGSGIKSEGVVNP